MHIQFYMPVGLRLLYKVSFPGAKANKICSVNQILPGMANTEASVRNLAVKAMGMCCYLKCDIIAFHLPILIQVHLSVLVLYHN